MEAAGGVVLRKTGGEEEVLLIERNGIWDLPKGKREEGESVSDCALREVAEETGLREITLTNFIGVTYHTYLQDDQKIEKKTFWYQMAAADESAMSPQQEEGITQVKWVELEEAQRLAGFQNLKEILNKVRSGVSWFRDGNPERTYESDLRIGNKDR